MEQARRRGVRDRQRQAADRRREAFLQRQSERRRDAQGLVRGVVAAVHAADGRAAAGGEEEAMEEEEAGGGAARPPRKHRGPRVLDQLSRHQLQRHDWLCDVPSDLASKWLVAARPEGVRCIVVACHGSTVAHERNGRRLARFPSLLPAGHKARRQHGVNMADATILDCILDREERTFHVIDIMCWRGYDLYNSSCEARLFTLASRLEETDGIGAQSQYNPYTFAAVPVFPAARLSLEQVYGTPESQLGFARDGFLFLHRDGQYDLDQITPLVLVWKDAATSRFFVEAPQDGRQHAVLRPVADGDALQLQTGDEPAVTVARVPCPPAMEAALPRFVRVSFATIDEAALVDVHVAGNASRRREYADSWLKIRFQWMARHEPLTIDEVLASG